MITRVCISINNRCNLACKYCHFSEKKDYIKESEMDVCQILDNITDSMEKNHIDKFKIGFVGNGEPLLDFDALKGYLMQISAYLKDGRIVAYTITNGLLLTRDMLLFFRDLKVNVGFSIDGLAEIHDKYRCNSHSKVMKKIMLYKEIMGCYPSMNCTVGQDILDRADETIAFFEQFNNRITFSRMIGKYGISLDLFNNFLEKASKSLNVRRGGYDCTMYGGLCGAGMNNYFFANGKVYICGNCIDLPPVGNSDDPLSKLENIQLDFDRSHCYKECVCE